MNQEKIGTIIKTIRKQNHLTQEKFANKFGVTFQAVSKWENGQNIPDISILKKICNEYKLDINDLLEGNYTKKAKFNKKIWLAISALLCITIIIIGITLFYLLPQDDFEFKTLASSADNFSLYGTIAYSDNKTSIYISNITYEGSNDQNVYKEIRCTLYEKDRNNKKSISTYDYKDTTILLNDFLKKVNFNINHYSNSCKMYYKDALYLEIVAKDINNHENIYKIPLSLKDCV